MNTLLYAISLLISVESGGNVNVPPGDNGKAIGILQIHKEVIADVDRVYHKNYHWPEDAQNPETSKTICELYLTYWATAKRIGHAPTLEDYCRDWNGGGVTGWKNPKTLPYWEKVETFIK